jgi:hypothetical protein
MNKLTSSTDNQPEPLKSIGNLTTQISTLGFNSDSQVAYAASDSKKEQMRMVGSLPHSKYNLMTNSPDPFTVTDRLLELADRKYSTRDCAGRRVLTR